IIHLGLCRPLGALWRLYADGCSGGVGINIKRVEVGFGDAANYIMRPNGDVPYHPTSFLAVYVITCKYKPIVYRVVVPWPTASINRYRIWFPKWNLPSKMNCG